MRIYQYHYVSIPQESCDGEDHYICGRCRHPMAVKRHPNVDRSYSIEPRGCDVSPSCRFKEALTGVIKVMVVNKEVYHKNLSL